MADGFTPIAVPVRSISAHVFATGIAAALDAKDYTEAKRLVRLWLGYLEDANAF